LIVGRAGVAARRDDGAIAMPADDLFSAAHAPAPAAPQSADPNLPGPFPVGTWAAGFREFLRGRDRMLLLGEVFNLRHSRTQTFFELRDAEGAAPCAIWNNDLERLKLPEGALRDGAEVVIGGGPDYYPGNLTASPGFSFRASYIRLAGEGDLLAQLERSRRALAADGLLEPQKLLARPAIPRTIGVVTARGSAACADLLAGLERRGWRGTIVWADAPVQDRRAAPAVGSALRRLAEQPAVEVAVVCRGGGSLTDLWTFCDEALCRTVAHLRLPIVAAVGHASDRTLIDEVAAVSCSTPTHAAEALIQLDLRQARRELTGRSARAARAGAVAIDSRARRLADLSRAPERSLRAERGRLHQMLREIRASATRGVAERRRRGGRHALVVARKGEAFAAADGAARAHLARQARTLRSRTTAARAQSQSRLDHLARAVETHDPQRTLERGYALVTERGGEAPISRAQAAREHREVAIRFADDAVDATIRPDDGSPEHPEAR
jgi:exodeoxyribonuclease VII large subunit